MRTFETLENAHDAVREMGHEIWGGHIVRIEHASQGQCYIISRAPMGTLAEALRRQPMPEIVRLIEDCCRISAPDLTSPDHKCERCGCDIDPSTCYHQTERTRLGVGSVRKSLGCASLQDFLTGE